jgi:hypothetical protein
MYYQRMWKTGVLAVVATIAFASFAFKIEEWTKGLRSESVVLGQTGTPPGGVTKIIPQIAVGSFDGNITKYTTVAEIVNTGSSTVSVTGSFYNQNGSPSALTFTTNLTATPTFSGTLAATNLAANQVLVITGDAASTGTLNWGKIVSNPGTVSVSSYFEFRDAATNLLYSRVGVQASAADMASFVIPRVRKVVDGLDVGFALVNTGTTSATLNATLRNTTGAILSSKSLTMSAGQHTAQFTQGFFGLAVEPGGTSYSFVIFDSTSSQFAAVALAVEGASMASFPVDRLR